MRLRVACAWISWITIYQGAVGAASLGQLRCTDHKPATAATATVNRKRSVVGWRAGMTPSVCEHRRGCGLHRSITASHPGQPGKAGRRSAGRSKLNSQVNARVIVIAILPCCPMKLCQFELDLRLDARHASNHCPRKTGCINRSIAPRLVKGCVK